MPDNVENERMARLSMSQCQGGDTAHWIGRKGREPNSEGFAFVVSSQNIPSPGSKNEGFAVCFKANPSFFVESKFFQSPSH
jgi:hypothetical protein